MQEAENLRTISEVAIAIAGFSGIVVVLGRAQSADRWEAARFRLLVTSSLSAALFPFLPLLMSSFGASTSTIWRASGAGLGAFSLCMTCIVLFPRIANPASGTAVRGVLFYPVVTLGILLPGALLAHALQVLPGYGPPLFFANLVLLLCTSVGNFAMLLLAAQRNTRE